MCRSVLRSMLRKHTSALVVEAEDGSQALDIIQHSAVDAVFLDLQMPVMDGLEVLAALRGDIAYHSLPVIVLSALSDLSTVRQAIKLGITDYLVKPLRPRLMEARLQSLLAIAAKRQATSGARAPAAPGPAAGEPAPRPPRRRRRQVRRLLHGAPPGRPRGRPGGQWARGGARAGRLDAEDRLPRARAAAAIGARAGPEAAQAARRDVALSLHRGARPHRRGGPGLRRAPAEDRRPRDLPQGVRPAVRRRERGGIHAPGPAR